MSTRINLKKSLSETCLAALVVAMAGCAGPVEPVGSADNELLYTAPLGSVDAGEDTGMLPGCAGQLEGGEHFAIAAGLGGLVAAVDDDGAVVCIDTVEAVEEELDSSGRADEADELILAYQAAMMAQSSRDARLGGGTRPGDPDPEPNVDFNRFRLEGDPDPEPNVGE